MMHITDGFADLNYWSTAITDYILQPFLMIILCLLSIFVVLGNLLVVTAIWHETQLHSVTNYLIASLAAADCLVGAVVMPFSIISEIIIGSWTFGATWCDMWHSFDVLASTASIMNLCAISLDRYLAITNPISYPRKMTPRRVALLIVSLWTCSSLISFPAIIWWRAVGPGSLQRLPNLTTTISPLEVPLTPSRFTSDSENESSLYRCVFTDDTYYLLFSSIVSFYGPLCVMLYAYYRIYKAAVQQTRFLKHGSKQVIISRNKKLKRLRNASELSVGAQEKYGISEGLADSNSNMESYERQHLVLRAHRGGGGSTHQSKMVNGDSSNGAKGTIDQRKREINNCDQVSQKDEGEHKSTEPNNSHPADRTDSSSGRSNINFNIKSSLRDKIRVERQRFDSETMSKVISYLSTEKNCHLEGYKDYSSCPNSNGVMEKNHKNEGIVDRCIESGENNMGKFAKREKQPAGRPLLASAGNRSTSVDVTIAEYPSPQDDRNHLYSLKDNKFCRDSNYTVRGLGGKMEVLAKKEACNEVDDGISDDLLECESFSASSDSYGTGSMASVLVRPQSNQRNSEERSNIEKNCDITDSPYMNNPRLRRAMSFEDSVQKDRNQWVDADGTIRDHTISIFPRSTPRDSSMSTQLVRKKANQGSSLYTKSSDIIVSFKTVKTLDIRSWMKLTRASRQPRSTLGNNMDNWHMRPPPSLVPLMMMNSDTSTDSSVAPAIEHQNERSDERRGEEKSERVGGFSHELTRSLAAENNVSMIHSANAKDVKTSFGLNEPIQLNHKSGSSKFEIDLERGDKNSKCQMVYYDSDKLIQSIVDLTAIRYIDCTNSMDRDEDNPKRHQPESRLNDSDKLQGNSVEQIQLNENERNGLPRQSRTVGKKLSKLAKERKAAKTLGIVVGVFILCWLPFFVVNIIVALCGTDCIFRPQILIAVVTWLGWLNSAMNPVIYACWSRDFRRAFRRVLCAWVEFICPYDESRLARMLRLKKTSNYSAHDPNLTRTYSSMKANTSSTNRSGLSLEGKTYGPANGGVSRNLLPDQ